VYRSGCWSGLQREAGLTVPAPGPHEDLLGDRLSGILHVDDPLRLAAYHRLLGLAESASVDADVDDAGLTDAERRLVTGFPFAVMPSKIAPASLAESVALLRAHPAIVQELRELIPLLDEQSDHLTYPLEMGRPEGPPLQVPPLVSRVPLSVHARHTVDDVLTAFGLLDFDKTAWKQTGVVRDDRTNSDLFFVTLEKSEREYSPSTLYKDYAISPTLGILFSSCAVARSRTAAPCRTSSSAHGGLRAGHFLQGRAADQLRLEIEATHARGLLQAGEGG